MSAVTATNFGKSLTITDADCLMEFATVIDTSTGSWAAAGTSLKVWSYDTTSTATRGTTSVTM